jgi:ribosome-associated heat shock protein Hsp15
MSDNACRVDVWLWRARFLRTRSLATAFVERGAVRLTHRGHQVRLDKPSRPVHPGDALTFAISGRVLSVRVEALGERRGPPMEARALYSSLVGPDDAPTV